MELQSFNVSLGEGENHITAWKLFALELLLIVFFSWKIITHD
jgi:hypothetical protein